MFIWLNIQGDQNVSVQLMTTIQKSGTQKLFDHLVKPLAAAVSVLVWHVFNLKLLEEDTEMSKNFGVYVIKRDNFVRKKICISWLEYKP